MAAMAAVLSWRSSAAAWLRKADIDAQWRVQKVRGRSVWSLVLFAIMALAKAAVNFAVRPDTWESQVSAGSIALVLGPAAFFLARTPATSSRTFELIEMTALVYISSAFGLASALDPDHDTRARQETAAFFLGFLLALFLSIRARHLFWYSSFHAAWHIFLFLVNLHHIGPCAIRWALTLGVIYVLFVLMGLLQGTLLKTFQLTEADLRQEQIATQSLVSMLCDGSCTVAADGDTIVDADSKFKHLLGLGVDKESLSAAVVGGENETSTDAKVNHFKDVFRRVAEGDATLWTQGGVVPVTLNAANGNRVAVTLFVVARRMASTKVEDGACSFLVGVTQSLEEERADVVGEVAELKGGAEPGGRRTRFDEISLSHPATGSEFCDSEVATELTANVFDVKTVVEEQMLSKILDLGQREHWLVREDEVGIKPQVVGTGSFGTVMLGSFFGASVVVKLVRSQSRPRDFKTLVHELRILRRCRHPNLVQFEGALFDMTHRRMALVLERADGGDLLGWRAQQPAPSEEALYSIVMDICNGLWYLHSRSPAVVHGDLKSGNVLVVTRGGRDVALLADFGHSALFEETESLQTRGTLRWMAPEVFRRELPAHPLSDIFSFGRIMEFMVTGELPHRGDSQEAIGMELLRGSVCPADLTGYGGWLAPELSFFASVCLVPDWQRRPTARELRARLLRPSFREPGGKVPPWTSDEECYWAWSKFMDAFADQLENNSQGSTKANSTLDTKVSSSSEDLAKASSCHSDSARALVAL